MIKKRRKRRKRRKTCYICSPVYLDLLCPNDPEHKITWSEWEKHIWCYGCKKDIEYKPGGAIIPMQVAKMIGVDFRRYNIKTGEVIHYE